MTSDPGRSSSRSDAGLATCQVHGLATPRRPHRLRSSPSLDWPASSPPTTQPKRLSDPPPERTRLLQIEVEGRALSPQMSPAYGAHLLARTGGADDGFDARDERGRWL